MIRLTQRISTHGTTERWALRSFPTGVRNLKRHNRRRLDVAPDSRYEIAVVGAAADTTAPRHSVNSNVTTSGRPTPLHSRRITVNTALASRLCHFAAFSCVLLSYGKRRNAYYAISCFTRRCLTSARPPIVKDRRSTRTAHRIFLPSDRLVPDVPNPTNGHGHFYRGNGNVSCFGACTRLGHVL